ncbi:aminopeptidase P N-terminal domain-containing protein [Ferrimonas futtsuensis]|uniref:aminopeptidase P N-terminal domain-containing protein n=1 Tax=Ferrimonas futtsuensis TaxID=364764 RepID=UPI00040D9FD8|nr:aminopeptidase P N-terminal domain-containing protein [Ferrimonas futtsuensis]
MNNEQHHYQQRRQRLMDTLGSDAAVILAAYPERIRSKNIHYRFVQDKDFYYLTGFEEPDAVALLRPGHPQSFILFSRPKDPAQETSFGSRAGVEGAIKDFGADAAYSLDELDARLPDLLEARTDILLGDEQERLGHKVWQWCNHQRRNTRFDHPKLYRRLRPLAEVLHPMRLIKDEMEIERIRHAVSASCLAHRQVIAHLKPGANEAELSCLFNLELARHDCISDPYPNILAGGERAMCLHYDHNNQPLDAETLLLIDAGGEYRHYAADITRTYPVSGHFSEEQAIIYDLVLEALNAATGQAKPGTPWNRLYDAAMEVISRGLIQLGILEGSLEQVMAEESHKPFTVHKTGHWLGLDVHDVGPYQDAHGQWLPLEAGMVLTIEPGLYFGANNPRVSERWRGIAIRIEDDILITTDGNQVLSKDAPKTRAEIESLMR